MLTAPIFSGHLPSNLTPVATAISLSNQISHISPGASNTAATTLTNSGLVAADRASATNENGPQLRIDTLSTPRPLQSRGPTNSGPIAANLPAAHTAQIPTTVQQSSATTNENSPQLRIDTSSTPRPLQSHGELASQYVTVEDHAALMQMVTSSLTRLSDATAQERTLLMEAVKSNLTQMSSVAARDQAIFMKSITANLTRVSNTIAQRVQATNTAICQTNAAIHQTNDQIGTMQEDLKALKDAKLGATPTHNPKRGRSSTKSKQPTDQYKNEPERAEFLVGSCSFDYE